MNKICHYVAVFGYLKDANELNSSMLYYYYCILLEYAPTLHVSYAQNYAGIICHSLSSMIKEGLSKSCFCILDYTYPIPS